MHASNLPHSARGAQYIAGAKAGGPSPEPEPELEAPALWHRAEPELVPPPWGATRANADTPPWQHVHARQQCYHRMLDEQNARKAVQRRQRMEEMAKINRPAAASKSTTKESDVEVRRLCVEKAVFHELLATVATRKQRDREKRESEKQDYARWVSEVEWQQTQQWHWTKQKTRQEWAVLAAAWRDAIEDKRARQEQERADTVLAEREAMQRLVQGMLPPRRVRKPRDREL